MSFEECVLNGKKVRAYLESVLPWEAELRRIPIKDDTTIIVVRQDDVMVGFACLSHCSTGVWLNDEMFYPKIHWKIAWVEINPLYKNKGHGTTIIAYIRDKFSKMNVPIALYARQTGNDFNLALWYYQLGAIILWNEEYEIENFLCFMAVDQIRAYIDDDVHNIADVVEFETSRSKRRVCKNVWEGVACGWILRNDEADCGTCAERKPG